MTTSHVPGSPLALLQRPREGEYRALRDEIAALDVSDPGTGLLIAHLGAQAMAALGGMVLFHVAAAWWAKIGCIVVASYGTLGVTAVGHTASHHAASRHRWLDRALSHFCFPFFGQVSQGFWFERHVQQHHPSPNVLGEDLDCEFRPWLITDDAAPEGTPLLTLRRRHQHLLFPLLLCVNAFSFNLQGWAWLGKRLRSCFRAHRHLRWHLVDLGCLLAHWVAFVVLPARLFGLESAIAFYVLRHVLIGWGMFCVLGPGHMAEEAVLIGPGPGARADFLLRQTVTTIDFRTGPLGAFLCAGLEYQIEHHLFPHVSYRHLARMQPVVERFCRARGYPYRRMGWARAVLVSARLMRRAKHVVRDDGELAQAVTAIRADERAPAPAASWASSW